MALAACFLLAALPIHAGKKDKQEAEEEGPRVRLSVSTHHGFAPLTVTLTGMLDGVEPDDQQYCHVGVEWETTSPLGSVASSRQDPRCLHPPEQVEVQFVFSKVVTLSRPGTYLYRLILYRRDGEPLRSNSQEIRVLVPN